MTRNGKPEFRAFCLIGKAGTEKYGPEVNMDFRFLNRAHSSAPTLPDYLIRKVGVPTEQSSRRDWLAKSYGSMPIIRAHSSVG